MPEYDAREAVLATWRTCSYVTAFLIDHLSDEVWRAPIPGAPRRTVRMIGGHIHNCRCMWVKALGKRFGLAVPKSVDRHRVTRKQLLPALARSATAMGRLLDVSLDHGGRLTGFSPPDVVHFLAYHAAHEGHHRGQIIMVARHLGHRLPASVTNGVWHWGKRGREAG